MFLTFFEWSLNVVRHIMSYNQLSDDQKEAIMKVSSVTFEVIVGYPLFEFNNFLIANPKGT